ncbi:MAG: DUF2345 domain-containing protein [Azonexus sp.]
MRFHWQQGESPDDRDSCWLRVLQRQAGAGTPRRKSPWGMGWQWLPRIGQEVLVDFLAGDIQPGDGNTGISLIAGQDDIDLQAQRDEMKFQAKQDMKLVSASAHIDFAAAKKIHLAVEGGASITIDGGITVQCPGTITVQASKKQFSGPVSQNYALPQFPQNVCVACLAKRGNAALVKVGE